MRNQQQRTGNSSSTWIVDPDPIKVQSKWHICVHETTWLDKVG